MEACTNALLTVFVDNTKAGNNKSTGPSRKSSGTADKAHYSIFFFTFFNTESQVIYKSIPWTLGKQQTEKVTDSEKATRVIMYKESNTRSQQRDKTRHQSWKHNTVNKKEEVILPICRSLKNPVTGFYLLLKRRLQICERTKEDRHNVRF